ncbi:MAG: AmmeMemoRadiSam system radical SAM enzyme [Spirochaetaceae bacterium]|jgi:pyruvate formate lyase activating enzyme|nr:AmmeMemoRadiSam system radical SAM enzyme [Spirochaetaceae bacterium]
MQKMLYAQSGNPLQCLLCPRACRIPENGRGICGVRGCKNQEGVLPYYAGVTALNLDPIEKKPLYHFRPGSMILSVGFAGCNLRCPFCQNWRISQNPDSAARYLSPQELIRRALSSGYNQIAYTYSEPLVHIEYLLECMRLARSAGVANVLVSNGCLEPAPASAVLALTDAANIDLKSGSEETYANILGGDLSAVTGFIAKAWEMGVHVEVTTLLVPGLNDGDDELRRCADVLCGISRDLPWHLTAYHPDYRWKAPPTDPRRIVAAAAEARKRLSYVYPGNI